MGWYPSWWTGSSKVAYRRPRWPLAALPEGRRLGHTPPPPRPFSRFGGIVAVDADRSVLDYEIPVHRSGLGEKGKYQIESANIRFGEYNSIAIRVYQSDSRPNFSVAPPVLMNESKLEAIRLECGTTEPLGLETCPTSKRPSGRRGDGRKSNRSLC